MKYANSLVGVNLKHIFDMTGGHKDISNFICVEFLLIAKHLGKKMVGTSTIKFLK